MAEFVYTEGLATAAGQRHSALVRTTHWINTASFFGLLVSGFAILLAHPRLYWGETGGVGTPSILDLPLPFLLGGPSGWGRYLHFLSAWVCVLNGLLYASTGLLGQHFRKDLLTYSTLQRRTYVAVIFLVFPLMIWTGLAMSPAIVSIFPVVVTVLGGQQSARTIHFFVAGFLVLFLLAHIGMVWRAGLLERVGSMITGRVAAGKEHG